MRTTDAGAIEISEHVWWVGTRLPNDAFQCHSYLIADGDTSVLIDPGSPLTIDETLTKVASVTDLESIRYLICHHPDPDIAAALPTLSHSLSRSDVEVVTEWRAQALLKHYGHRFDYWLVEDHDWSLVLPSGRTLEFQLTPYLHFPGAFMSYDAATGTLFSSDVFGGFVPENARLYGTDIQYILESARPFHRHYMPSSTLLAASLERVRRRWPHIDRIAPQHGHIIDGELVEQAFDGLSTIACGVFALTDADHELKHLLRLSEAREQLHEALLTVADPGSLTTSLATVLRHAGHPGTVHLYIDVPQRGWECWSGDGKPPTSAAPDRTHSRIDFQGSSRAALQIRGGSPEHADIEAMVASIAPSMRPAIDAYLTRLEATRRINELRAANHSDPLTRLGNRRALEEEPPQPDCSLIALDLDHFKQVNDTHGHAAGDIVLQAVARAIESEIREGDLAYRLGGEEFLIALPATSAATAAAIVERLRARIARLDLRGHAPHGSITTSAGVSTYRAGDTLSTTLERAYEALYESKRCGRNRITVAESRMPSSG